MKTGLVLEGGGMRGIYTAGVLDAMDEAGLRAAFDGVIGVSAGGGTRLFVRLRAAGAQYPLLYQILPRPGAS